jgi:CheY-like chemotaxis protein
MLCGLAPGALAHAPAVFPSAALSTTESLMKPLLLLAERDAELREVYREFLAARGYDVDTAADGLECLTKLRRLAPAVLVLDRELHWGGGDGVLAWLREQDATAEVAVVLTATAGCPPYDDDDLRPPVVRLLPKPFALITLLDSVRAATDGRHEQRFDRMRAEACSELHIG